MKIKLANKEIKLFLLVGIIIFFLPLLLTQFSFGISFMNTGEIGDTIGGITTPFLSFFAAILVYLAFKAQIDANENTQNQFNAQKLNEDINFAYSKFKERIYLIINEVDNFEVGFVNGKLISKLEELNNNKEEKYKFTGIQGLNLFLIEYFRDKKQKEIDDSKVFNYDDAFHSIMLSIMNLIVLFYNTHIGIIDEKILNETYKNELNDLLTYTFQSKLSFVVELYYQNYATIDNKKQASNKFFNQITTLREAYRLSKEPEISEN